MLAGPAVGVPADQIEEAMEADRRGDHARVVALLAPLEKGAREAPVAARLHALLAFARAATADYDGALRSADDGERPAREANDALALSRIEGARGLTFLRRGFMDRALRHELDAVRWAERTGDPHRVADSLTRLAQVHRMRGDWARVIETSERAFAAQPDPTPTVRGRYLAERGIAYYEFHDRDQAEKNFSEAREVALAAGERELAAFAAFELGLLYWTFDRDADRARRHYQQVLAEAPRSPNAVHALNEMGNLHREAGQPARALELYERALRREREMGGGRATPTLLKNSGQVLVRLGREPEGERRLLEARALADAHGNQRIRWQAPMELALLHRRRDPALADGYFNDTLNVLEDIYSNVLLDDMRASGLALSRTFYDPYDLYITFLIEQGRTADAFVVSERARARAFLATLSAAREQVAGAVPAEFLEQEKEVLRRISEHQAALRARGVDGTRRAELLQAVQREEERLAALRLQLATDNSRLAQARYPRLWTAAGLQEAVVGDREAVAVFFVGKHTSACWVIRKDRLALVRLPAAAEVERLARALVDALRAPGTDARTPARALHDQVVAPLLAAVPEGWRLVVVPHGVLHYVPLETALDPAGRYLIERNPVSYAPSASSLAYLRSLPPTTPAADAMLLAVGDPELARDAPAPERALDPSLLALLKPLAHGADEVRRISGLFGSAARVLTRERATEAELSRVDGRTVRVLHFATHGLLDDRHPDRSALALTARPPAHDGLLQAREVFQLRLNARLVTLSACQTALGKELTGEGLVGLARAFFYAGADAVMASLWSVDDASSARWMVDFYTRLGSGDDIDDAARGAKLGFIRAGGAHAHPYYWAPFIVTGHAAVPVGLRGARPWRGVALGALAAAVTAASLVLTLRARRRRRAERS
jgi:CHAT domain-containing protein/tetratricopeptide (TPR) repeat protein